MAEQIGIVARIEEGGWAQVVTDRKNACGGCNSDSGGACRFCLAGTKMQVRVPNHLGAQKCDVVKFAIGSTDFFKGALVLYIMPVLALMSGALAGSWMSAQIGWQQTSGALLGVVAGLAAAMYLLMHLDRSQWARRRLSPRMTAVLKSKKSMVSRTANAPHACWG